MAAINHIMLSEAVANNRFSAEFFDPQYVFKPVDSKNWTTIGRILEKCEYGISISMNSNGKGYPIFRMNEINNCFALRPEKHASIPKALFDRYKLQPDDVLFNRTNSFEFVGRTGLVKDQTDCTFASYLIRLVPNSDIIRPEFLAIYLNTQFGIGQIKRRAMRSINQANVSGSEVKKILIPTIEHTQQEEVADFVNNAFNSIRKSEASLLKAKKLLESDLGLDKLSFSKPIGYTALLSDIIINSRFDADYYQAPFLQIQEHLNNFTTIRLSDAFEIIKGIEVGSKAYISTGRPFLRVSNIKEMGIITGEANDKYISDALYELLSEYRPKVGELLLTKDGSPGICFAIDQDVDGIISGGIVRLLPKNENIPNEYLALVINSIACRMQIEQECSGALILHWKPSSIRKLRIPILSDKKMNIIADLVSKSKQFKRESDRLLDQAITRVEQLIQEAVQS